MVTGSQVLNARDAGESYSVIICCIWVLVTSDDFWGHPVRCPNEGVSPSNCPIQLSTHAKIHWRDKERRQSVKRCTIIFKDSISRKRNGPLENSFQPSYTQA